MPNRVLSRTHKILSKKKKKKTKERLKHESKSNYKVNLFDSTRHELEQVKEKLEAIEINTFSPVEALVKLKKLKGVLSK